MKINVNMGSVPSPTHIIISTNLSSEDFCAEVLRGGRLQGFGVVPCNRGDAWDLVALGGFGVASNIAVASFKCKGIQWLSKNR